MGTLLHLSIASIAAPLIFVLVFIFEVATSAKSIRISDLDDLGAIFLMMWIGSLVLSLSFGAVIILILRRFELHRIVPLALVAFSVGALLSMAIGISSVQKESSGSGFNVNGVDLRVDGLPTIHAWVDYFQNALLFGVMAASVAVLYYFINSKGLSRH